MPAWKGMLLMKCPQCRQSPVFVDPNPYKWKGMGKMYKVCPSCGHPIDQEYGYFVGAMYFSYALMVAWNFTLAVAVYIFTGQLFENYALIIGLGIVTSALISPVIFRYSRVIWMYLFFKVLKK